MRMGHMKLEDVKMQLWRLVMAVRKMRRCQKQYFKTRDKDDLVYALDAEKDVDSILSELKDAP